MASGPQIRQATRFFADELGAVAPAGLFAFLFVLCLGGVAVDTSYAYLMRNKLQISAEAAALAAARELPSKDAVRAKGLEYIEKNMPSSVFGQTVTAEDIAVGAWDAETRTFTEDAVPYDAVRVVTRRSESYGGTVPSLVLYFFGFDGWTIAEDSVAMLPGGCVGDVTLGALSDYLFVYTDASSDGNWQAASKGFVGNVAVDGIQASERTSGTFDYSGTIYTNDGSAGAWEAIVSANSNTANSVVDEDDRIAVLEYDLANAMSQIDALPASPGYESVSALALDGLNTQDGISETYVINITSDLKVDELINITGDAGDAFVMRWDEDLGTPGYQGQVKFQSGGAINPLGGLVPSNFVHVAGDLNASGGGSNPSGLAPYLAEIQNEVNGGGFFTGYWLTTGDPDDSETSSLSNAIFVGGWYSSTTKFSMTSGTSGVYVAPVMRAPRQTCPPSASAPRTARLVD